MSAGTSTSWTLAPSIIIIPIWGLTVVKGNADTSTSALVRFLRQVLFPLLGNPMRTIWAQPSFLTARLSPPPRFDFCSACFSISRFINAIFLDNSARMFSVPLCFGTVVYISCKAASLASGVWASSYFRLAFSNSYPALIGIWGLAPKTIKIPQIRFRRWDFKKKENQPVFFYGETSPVQRQLISAFSSDSNTTQAGEQPFWIMSRSNHQVAVVSL